MEIMVEEIKSSITEVLISIPCDCNHAYILTKSDITIIAHVATQAVF